MHSAGASAALQQLHAQVDGVLVVAQPVFAASHQASTKERAHERIVVNMGMAGGGSFDHGGSVAKPPQAGQHSATMQRNDVTARLVESASLSAHELDHIIFGDNNPHASRSNPADAASPSPPPAREEWLPSSEQTTPCLPPTQPILSASASATVGGNLSLPIISDTTWAFFSPDHVITLTLALTLSQEPHLSAPPLIAIGLSTAVVSSPASQSASSTASQPSSARLNSARNPSASQRDSGQSATRESSQSPLTRAQLKHSSEQTLRAGLKRDKSRVAGGAMGGARSASASRLRVLQAEHTSVASYTRLAHAAKASPAGVRAQLALLRASASSASLDGIPRLNGSRPSKTDLLWIQTPLVADRN